MNEIVKSITQSQLKQNLAPVKVGDSVQVYKRVREGGKERTQIFAGIIIAMNGSGIQSTVTVRRVISGLGIECIFPVHSPNVEKIVVDRESVVRRSSKLYYMRKRVGKGAMAVKEKRFHQS